MSTLQPGDSLPDLDLPATGGQALNLAGLKGRPVVLYFYPKDNTPGCTQEGQDFRDRHAEFAALGAVVLGVSRDTQKTHENFKNKHGFPFDLLADTQQTLCGMFGVVKPKTMFGKPVTGIERSTFLFDKNGVLRREWRKVKVPGHVEEVLAAVRTL